MLSKDISHQRRRLKKIRSPENIRTPDRSNYVIGCSTIKLALISVHLYYTLFLVTANNGIEGKKDWKEMLSRDQKRNWITSKIWPRLANQVLFSPLTKRLLWITSRYEKRSVSVQRIVDNLRITYIYVHLISPESKYLKYRRPQLQKEGVKTRHLSYIG